VTLTVTAHCHHDAPALGKAIIRGALRDSGITFEGRLAAEVQR
jgi:hypothetical protein